MLQTNPTENPVGDGYFNNSSGAHAANWVQWAIDNNVSAPVWEIGNEPDLYLTQPNDYQAMQWYFNKFNEHAVAMKQKNPNIIISGGVLSNTWHWWALNTLEMFINSCGHNTDAVSLHWYGDNNPTYEKTRGFAQSWQNNWNFIRSKTNKPIYITEWNSFLHNSGTYPRTVGLAISNADVIGAFAKTGVEGHAYFGCIHLVDNNWGMFLGPNENMPLDTPTPAYYMFPLWKQMGPKVLNATHNANPSDTLNVWAHKKDDGSVQVMIINKSGAHTVNIGFNGYDPTGKTVSVYQLRSSSNNPLDHNIYYNNIYNPSPQTNDLPLPTIINVNSSTFTYNAPAYSITVLDFSGGETNPPVYPGKIVPGMIEAEDYDSMYGIQTEQCSEGTMNVGWIDAGDWMDYVVNVQSTGTYLVEYRVASPNTSGKIEFRLDGAILSTISIPSTGGWQSWTTVTTSVNLQSGTRTIRLHAAGGGFNINWFRLTNMEVLDRTGWTANASHNTQNSFRAIDGDSNTRWDTGVQQSNGQSITIDMKSSKTFGRIVLDTSGSPNDYPRGYRVDISNNGIDWVTNIANGSGNGSVTDINFSPRTARYIRIVQTGSTSWYWWSIHELNVFGISPVEIKIECETGTRTNWSIQNQTGASNSKGTIATSSNNSLSFNINIPITGTYKLYINNSIGSGGWSRQTYVDVGSINNVWQGTLPAAVSGQSWENFRLTDLGNAILNAGVHTITVRHGYFDGYEHLYDYILLVRQ
ncbi:MAG: carbohydrate-binding protein [Thermoplasmata archaeon]